MNALKMIKNKLLIAITGSIAAYKTVFLVREAVKAGYEVKVVLTKSAKEFVTPLTLQALSGNRVHMDLFDLEAERSMGHIELAKWADLILIAPCSANTIGKIAHGIADNLLMNIVLAKPQETPLLIAPAMNVEMYNSAVFSDNLNKVRDFGYKVLDTGEGAQACGDVGYGRMLEPEQLLEIINNELGNFSSEYTKPVGYTLSRKDLNESNQHAYQVLGSTLRLPHDYIQPKPKSTLMFSDVWPQELDSGKYKKYIDFFKGKKVLITAGPTREMIDPVRYITNHSSGKMGLYIAALASKLGAKVTVVAGPVSVTIPEGLRVLKVESAEQMNSAVLESLDGVDLFIGCAAVGDFRAKEISSSKIKKTNLTNELNLTLVKNPDILYNVAHAKLRPTLVVGFAAETQNVEEYAKSKIITKGCDAICANDVSKENQGWNSDYNRLIVYKRDGNSIDLGYESKECISKRLLLDLAKTLYLKAHKEDNLS